MLSLRILTLFYAFCLAAESPGKAPALAPAGTLPRSFTLRGLISPAIVTESVFVFAGDVPPDSTVRYYVDGRLISTESEFPYWLGGARHQTPVGFKTTKLGIGTHSMKAVASQASAQAASNTIQFQTIPSINLRFSSSLASYRNHGSAQQLDIRDVLARTSTRGASLTPVEQQARLNILAMFLNWGINPSLDCSHFQSQQLLDLGPKNWAPARYPTNLSSDAHLMSPDAPFYQKIPAVWPRSMLPAGHIRSIQLNTTQQGDGIGFGVSFSNPGAPSTHVRAQWYSNTATGVDYWLPIASDWSAHLPWQTKGDERMIFVDTDHRTFLSTYKTSIDTAGKIHALAAGGITALNTLGDRGGSTAARFAELPVLIRPGEVTDPKNPIAHAIGGSIHRTWMTRVFPASGWDYGIEKSTDSCTGKGFTNTGLLPYGSVIQLDPGLDLTTRKLSLPALRILQAMQQYGYYVMGYGCSDMDIYTSLSEAEINAFGGLWGYNRQGPGVQNELNKILTTAILYVVPPLTKKE